MKKIFIVVGITPVLLLTICTLLLAGELEDRITKGNALVQKKEFKKAVKEYEAAVAADPKNPKANLLLGLSLANVGDWDKAVRYSVAASKLDPSHATYHNLGLVYANRGDLDKAVDAYQKAIAMNSSSATTWYQLGLVYSSKGDFRNAVDSYNKVLELNPRIWDAYLGLGSAYYWLGDRPKCLEQVEKLKSFKMAGIAADLEIWIKRKDDKKKQADEKSAERVTVDQTSETSPAA